MTPGLTSIIICTYQHGQYLADAIESALAQTSQTEVIVVDDGSTDNTPAVMARYGARIKAIVRSHEGLARGRNAGIEAASGEFVMFLDADDVIAPRKVATQIAGMTPDIGWVLCDVRIEDGARGKVELASERYRYDHRNLGGWIRDQLAASNFIPVHSPLIRRSVLTEDVRFGEIRPEDWHFFYRLAAHARCRYIPDVLATYRKRRDGRNAKRDGVAHISPSAPDGPLVLNLGCGTPGAASWHPIDGAVNLDRSMGWMFEDGLPQYRDGAVDAITISHAGMYVDERDWPAVMAELFRVLKPGGVLRLTEDDTEHPKSSRIGGWKGSEPAVTLTGPVMAAKHLEAAGFTVYKQTAGRTKYAGKMLLQAQHGKAPDVFFIEGVKP